jgi:hypothetical protein
MRYAEREASYRRMQGIETQTEKELREKREAARDARNALAERKARRETAKGVALFAEPDPRGRPW